MLSFTAEKTRAILIGSSTFRRDPGNLPSIPAVRNNVADLKRVLVDPSLVGIPSPYVLDIIDPIDRTSLLETISANARAALDTLIVYYAGHGLIGDHSPNLLLAVGSTTKEEAEFNALDFDTFRRAISRSPAPKKVLILDSCFSGRAFSNVLTTPSSVIQAAINLRGTFGLASTPPNRLALAPPGAQHTAFTGKLLEVLEKGIDGCGEFLTLEDLFHHLIVELGKDPKIPLPRRVNNLTGEFLISRNRQFVLERADSDEDTEKERKLVNDPQATRSPAEEMSSPAQAPGYLSTQAPTSDPSYETTLSGPGGTQVLRTLGFRGLASRFWNPEQYLTLALEWKCQQREFIKQRFAHLIADERRLKGKLEQAEADAIEWEKRAALARRQGRDDLANMALSRWEGARRGFEMLLTAHNEAQPQVEQVRAKLRKLNEAIDLAKIERDKCTLMKVRLEAQASLGDKQNRSVVDAKFRDIANRLLANIEQ